MVHALLLILLPLWKGWPRKRTEGAVMLHPSQNGFLRKAHISMQGSFEGRQPCPGPV